MGRIIYPIDEMENNPNVRNHQPVRDFPLRGTKLRSALEPRMPQNSQKNACVWCQLLQVSTGILVNISWIILVLGFTIYTNNIQELFGTADRLSIFSIDHPIFEHLFCWPAPLSTATWVEDYIVRWSPTPFVRRSVFSQHWEQFFQLQSAAQPPSKISWHGMFTLWLCQNSY